MRNKIYIPPLTDIIITVLVTLVLGCTGGFTWKNDAFWILLIYIVSWGFTNLNKRSIIKMDRKNDKKRKKFQKKHIQNPRSNKKELPHKLAGIDERFDYDSCFQAIKLVLGMLVTVILAIISDVGRLSGTDFDEFAFYFYIDAFLLPLLIMLFEAFLYKQSPRQAIKEFLKTLFYKNGKPAFMRGVLGLVALIILLVLALVCTMMEFTTENVGIILRVFFFLCGLGYLGYCLIYPVTQKEEQNSKTI